MAVENNDIQWFAQMNAKLLNNIEQEFIGKSYAVQLVLSSVVAKGHILLEDVPGTGKTHLARVLSKSIGGISSRVQFTPDLLPSDITGVSIYDQKSKTFEFNKGPIFANVVLGDEINRASPKTQSAMLEVMEEGAVTVDGETRDVPQPFLVIATQNPVEQAGTYSLPEAQLDRFLIKASIGYTDHATTISIIDGILDERTVEEVASLDDVLRMQKVASEVFLDPAVSDYIVRLIEATRVAPQVRIGSSVRGAISLKNMAKAWAAANGRVFVTPDDVKALAVPVLAHRLILQPEAEFDGVTAEAVINQILLDQVVPQSGTAAGGVAAPVAPIQVQQTQVAPVATSEPAPIAPVSAVPVDTPIAQPVVTQPVAAVAPVSLTQQEPVIAPVEQVQAPVAQPIPAPAPIAQVIPEPVAPAPVSAIPVGGQPQPAAVVIPETPKKKRLRKK